MYQTVKCLNGADICVKSQFFAHAQQALLRTNLRCGVIVILGITDGGKQHRVTLHACLESIIGERVAHQVDGVRTADCLAVLNLVSELAGYGVYHCHTLLHYLGADTIAGQYCYLKFHNVSILFIIFTVALIAASVWSASSPRVLNSLPLKLHVIMVCTKASVRPPGGIDTV